jgi:hypothetical protein
MSQNLQIVWRGVEPSDTLREHIAQHADALGANTACRVTVGRPHRDFHVTIAVGDIAITREDPGVARDAYAAVGSAFDRLQRRLDADGPRRRAVLRRARRSH